MSRILLILGFFSINAFADWQLDPEQSRLNFISVKNDNIAEVHTFDKIKGEINGRTLNIAVAINSVNTVIPIRNERLQTLLFNAAEFPVATFSAEINDGFLALAVGEKTTGDVSGTLALSGKELSATFSVSVVKIAENSLLVSTTKPYILNASEAGLSKGVEALRNIAGLKVISQAVPITFNVVFDAK